MDDKECQKILSANIKRFRNRLGLSQLNLSLELGISSNFLSDVENGKKWVSLHTLVQMANALNIEVFELFKPEEKLSDDVTTILGKCLDDVSVSVRKSIEVSIKQSVEQALGNVRAFYLP